MPGGGLEGQRDADLPTQLLKAATTGTTGVRRAERFSQCFGLAHIDFETQKRTPRASYGWYCDLIATQRAGGGR
ncbi:family 1 glycosylhydrolase [Saccharothrix sp. ST-888]|uniref:family 1 glycosylhydrolase n=1 Tax=Saccharothrix sp. ST-888 TaxID=1427391 RepID=UPI0012E01526